MRQPSDVKSFLICGFIFALFVLNVLLGVYGYSLKERFHVDELYSYAHSNSTQGAYLGEHIDSFRHDEKNEVHNKWLDAKIFHDYLTVQPEERFEYGHIWENLFVVEHPPLYFVLLHTVCSFFSDIFSKWLGAALNFVVWIFLLLMFLKLARLFFSSELIAVLTVALYAYSNAGMGMLLYIRMYLLQTLFAVCLMYETVKMLKENAADNKRLFLIFLYSALGMLTQYSSLVFSFIAAGTGGGILCWRKNWRLLFRYAAAMALSPMVLFAVFPAAWDVLLNSQRGEELRASVCSLGHIFLRLENSFDRLFSVYQTELFSLRAIYEQTFLFILIMGGTFLKLCDKKMSAEAGVCLVESLGMGFFLALFMPEMGVFDLRYFSLLMPFLVLLSVLFVVRILEAAGICQSWVIGILGLGVLLNSLTADFRQRSAFVFGCDDRFSSFVSDVRGKKIVVKTNIMQPYFDGLGIYRESDGVFLTRDRCLSSVRQDVFSADFVLVYNSYAQYCLECSPKPKQLCLEDYAFVRYVSSLRIGIVYFDLYDVIK